MRLLHIEASPRGPRSRSTMVANRLLDRLGDASVERLNMFEADLPAFDGAAIEGRYALIAGEAVGAEAASDWARIEALVAHLLGFDAWLISVPMWNFGIPYRLKHYVDLVTQPGLAFSVDANGAVEGKAAGRTVILVGSGALDTRPGGDLAGLDHQLAYLESWLRFIGVEDIRIIRIQPTYGTVEIVDAAMARAYLAAEALAADLSRPPRV